ncbi:DUF6959 family protein [Micromonospora sp. NPDC049282]|uniref:DUF6959 family protein n=1 Tax=Micromonospora sp. NPDC049282 TaxID=3364269 RepID=UPI00371F6406
MSQEQAQVLSRGTNCAVVQLAGRAFPGIHLQGDTFAALLMQPADAARLLRHDPGDRTALDELDEQSERQSASSASTKRRSRSEGSGGRTDTAATDGSSSVSGPALDA